MTHIAHTETLNGVTLKIILDDCGLTDGPADDDSAVIFAALHRHYINPAKKKRVAKPFNNGDYDFTTVEGLEAFEHANAHKSALYAVFPLFLYDHSGTSYRCSMGGNPFSCPWDSGRVGLIALRKSDVGTPGKKIRRDGKVVFTIGSYFKQAQDFCDNYTSWANGEIYGYVIEDSDGDHLDSCWGFIGDPSGYVLEEGRESLKHHAAKAIAEEASEQESARPDLYQG